MPAHIRSRRLLALVAFALPAPALAADLPTMPRLAPAPVVAPVIDDTTGYYLRGDVGLGVLSLGKLSQQELSNNGGTFLSKSVGDTPYLSIGAGVKLTSWLRTDVTGEYRGAVHLGGYDNLSLANPARTVTLQANTLYSGQYSSAVGLFNLYGDLGTWNKITPYVGAGAGVAYNRMSGFTDSSIGAFTVNGTTTTTPTSGVLGDKAKLRFAWALMAGASYDLSDNAKLDIGYRYLNLGSGVATSTGAINCSCGSVGSPLQVHSLHANEIRIGIRWLFEQATKPAPHTVVAKY